MQDRTTPNVVTSAPTTVLVADPEELVREALGAFCVNRGGYRLAALAGDGEEALEAVRLHTPSLAIANLDLPRLHTLELVSRCFTEGLATRFVILANRFDRKTVLESLRAGAKGFILRSGSAVSFFDALEQVRMGGVYLAPQVGASRLFV